MPNRSQDKCAGCGHVRSLHTRHNIKPCAKKVPVYWVGRGRNRSPIIGYCQCDRFRDQESE